jgi:hypothetical protein
VQLKHIAEMVIMLVKVSAAVGAVAVLAAAPALFVSMVFAPVAFAPIAFASTAFINTQHLPSQIDNINHIDLLFCSTDQEE